MKKLILLIAAILTSVASYASEPFLEVQPFQAGDITCFNVQAGVMYNVHPNINAGVGVGVTERWNFKHGPLIPIFGRGELTGELAGLNPFLSLDLGYEINTGQTKNGAVLVNPMVGLKFGKFYGGIGYLGHCWTSENSGTASCFNVKVGMTF
jgi:hypothetical protein